jgi:hypothetical protein
MAPLDEARSIETFRNTLRTVCSAAICPKYNRCVVSGTDFSFTAAYQPLRLIRPSHNPLCLFLLAGASNLRKDAATAASPSPALPQIAQYLGNSGIPRCGIIRDIS